MTKCQYALLVKEIELNHSLKSPFCTGCGLKKEDHQQSQCLENTVEFYFNKVYNQFDEAECLRLAEKYFKSTGKTLIQLIIKDKSMAEIKSVIIRSTKDKELKSIMDFPYIYVTEKTYNQELCIIPEMFRNYV